MRAVLLLTGLLLAACDSGTTLVSQKKDIPVNRFPEIKANLAFTCAHEKIPEVSVEADVVFQYARWLQKNNLLKQEKSVDGEVERLYRIAAENGHYKANINLQNGAMRGRFDVRSHEHLRMSQQLIDAGVASGYYLVAIFLQQGAAGLQQDSEMALRYYRKAADEGSSLAQYYVGDKLAPIDIAPDIGRKMLRCAAEQGHGQAAVEVGINLKNKGEFEEALKVFHMGISAGNSNSAYRMAHAFRGPLPTDKLEYLGQQEDVERADRYEQIWSLLADYSYADPKVPEINEIVPLPPAKLPEWDGKLQWVEARKANIPPEKPSEALINRLAKTMVLDPATGKPMPGSPSFTEVFLEPTCASGQACPVSGYWKVKKLGVDESLGQADAPGYFKKGQVMPTAWVWSYHERLWGLSYKRVCAPGRVIWGLLA